MSEAAVMMGGEILSGDPTSVIRGAVLDSRKASPGDLFFALPGKRTDGHCFVDGVLEVGATAVVEKRYLRLDPEARSKWTEVGAVLQVEDGLAALHRITRAVRLRTPEKLVGITGSAGKTTTKEILSALLATRFRVSKSPGNLNSLFGFPLALMGISEDTEWMVAELGMSEPGELAQLSRLARPDVAVLTNVGPAHLEFFGSLRAIARAKAELLEGLADGGLIIANGDDPEVRWIVERSVAATAEGRHGRVLFYGQRSGDAGVRGENVRVGSGGVGSAFDLVVDEERQAIELPLHGTYNVDNFLAAAACATALGIPLGAIAAAATQLQAASGRGRLHVLEGGGVLVDDSYNSNPNAALRALESAATLSGARRWAILGDMLELGPAGPDLHREVGASAARLGFSPVVGVGTLSRHLAEAAKKEGAEAFWFEDAASAAEWAAKALRPADMVLVKGSRGAALDIVVEALLAASSSQMSGEGSN